MVAVSFLLNIFTSHKVSIFALKKEINFAEEITIIDEKNDNEYEKEIDNEVTEENVQEVEDEEVTDDESEVSETSETTENENTEDGIATIDDSSDYTITVTEYTGDTLEAEYDYESESLILYVIDAETLTVASVTQLGRRGI